MKIIAPLFCLIMLAASTDAQTAASTKPATQLETFQGKVGSVVIKGFNKSEYLKGPNGTIEVDALEFTDAQTKTRISGIVVEIVNLSQAFNSVLRSRAFVDLSEIDSLIAGIDYIEKMDATATRFKNFEASYRTTGDLRIVVFNRDNGELRVLVECDNPSADPFLLKVGDLSTLRKMIADARDMLTK